MKIPRPNSAAHPPVSRVKDVPSVQPPAHRQPLIRGGATSGSPGQLVRFWNRWRENYNALADLTLARVRVLLEMVQRGDMAYPQWTYRTIERRHPVLSALITCCEAPLENFQWDVVVKKELPAGFTAEAAARQRTALRAAYGQIDNLPAALQHLAHADFTGYAHVQKHYGVATDGTEIITHLECLYPYCLCRDGLFGDWFWNPDSLALTVPATVLTEANRVGGPELPRTDFLIREVPRPINEIALENFVRRKLIEKDWSAFDEIFGIPSGVVIMPDGIPPEKVAEYEAAARQISEGGSGAMPAGSNYIPNDQPRDGSLLFKNHLSSLDEDLVLAGTGGKLKMLVEQGHPAGGNNVRGNSQTQADTFLEIAAARGGQVSACFQRDFDRVWLAEHFPGQPALVEFRLITEDDHDLGELCANLAALAPAGVKPDVTWLNEITGYQLVADDGAPAALPTPEPEPVKFPEAPHPRA